MPSFWAFDVDECLSTSNGPVTVQMLKDLWATGAILGICGNLSAFDNQHGVFDRSGC